MGLWKRIRKSYHKFLISLADENKKTFGEGKLDCCQLNRKSTEAVRKK